MIPDRDRVELLRTIGELRENERALLQSINSGASGLNTHLQTQRALLAEALTELKRVNQERLKGYKEQESQNKSLGDMYKSLSDLEQRRMLQTIASSSISAEQEETLNRMAEINRDLAQTSISDVVAKQSLNEEYKDLLDSLQGVQGIDQQILDNLAAQNTLAQNYSNMTEGQKEQLKAQLEVYGSIGKALYGILDTAATLTSGPAGFFGTVLIGAGALANKLGEVRSQLGGLTELGTTALAFFDDNAVANAKELASQFGGMNNVSGELQTSISLISANMGITGVEAASLAGSFARLNGGSEETALNLTKATQEFAAQNGIIPSDLMADLANSAEEFALFGKDGGKNIIAAGAAAKKMGVDLKTMSGIADNLLDFETSITKELELGALLGKDINLDKARQLAYSGDIAGATKETLSALGGIDGFNKMDYYSKKATAELLGTSVAELQKMVSAEEEAARLAGTIGGQFSLAGEAIDAGLNKYLGTSLEALGGMVMAGAQLGGSFAQMGFDVKGMASRIPIIGTLFGGGGAPAPSPVPGPAPGPGGPPIPPVPDGGGGDLKSLAEGLKEMGSAKVLFGALNLIPTAAGLALMVIGIPSMMALGAFGANAGIGLELIGVGLQALGTGTAFVGALTLSAAAVGFALMTAGAIGLAAVAIGGIPAGAGLSALAAGLTAIGSAAATGLPFLGVALIAAFGVSLIPLTFALSLLAPLVTSIGNVIIGVITAVAGGISTIIGSIGQFMTQVLPLFSLENAAGLLAMAAGFGALSLSLMGFAMASIMAIPGMIAVGAFLALGGGELLGGGGEGEGAGGSDMDELINEIKGLRADLSSGKIAVNMDGASVTARVSSYVDRSNKNSYAK
jgi:hypothetical protein